MRSRDPLPAPPILGWGYHPQHDMTDWYCYCDSCASARLRLGDPEFHPADPFEDPEEKGSMVPFGTSGDWSGVCTDCELEGVSIEAPLEATPERGVVRPPPPQSERRKKA